jgi:formate--tetrahydrofolate ligase
MNRIIEQFGNTSQDRLPLSGTRRAGKNGKLVSGVRQDADEGRQGMGKTTITVGLADGLQRIGKRRFVALREPSLGPVFGNQGRRSRRRLRQVSPMEDITFISPATFMPSPPLTICWQPCWIITSTRETGCAWTPGASPGNRCLDMNDRQLRFMINGLGGLGNGVPREDGFDITAASEIMAVLCLSANVRI